MVDEPSTRVGRFAVRLDQLERTFVAGGIYPDDADSRNQFGEDHRKMREFITRRESRGKWMVGIATTLIGGIVTALAVSQGPTLLRALAQGLIGK